MVKKFLEIMKSEKSTIKEPTKKVVAVGTKVVTASVSSDVATTKSRSSMPHPRKRILCNSDRIYGIL